MADDELKALLEDGDGSASEVKPEVKAEDKTEDSELKAKREQLENLQKAIGESQEQLKKIRKEKQTLKQGQAEEEELPRINLEDPSAKAWDRHIKENVAPVQAADERAREEVRGFALKVFLKDKPSLSRNPEKLKEVMTAYEALSQGKISERTQEGVLDYLDRAYGAVFHEELTQAASGQRFEQAQADAAFSDIAVSRGATSYSTGKEVSDVKLSEDDKKEILRMGYSSVAEWIADKKKYG